MRSRGGVGCGRHLRRPGVVWTGDVAGLTSGMREANIRPWRGRRAGSRAADFIVRSTPLWAYALYGQIMLIAGVALLVDAAR